MRLHVSYLDDKWVWTVWLPVDDELSHDNCPVGGPSQRPNPPLGGCKVRRVNDEALVFRVPCCGGLETSHIRTVAKLCLSITANVLVVLRLLQKPLVLLIVALITKGDLQYCVSEGCISLGFSVCLPRTCSHADHMAQAR